jgi:DNA gyrase/topoisomerase IV subunit B
VIKKKSVNVKTNQSKQQSKHREKFWNIYCAASVDEDTFEGTSEFCTTTNPPTDTAVSEKGFSAERERERERERWNNMKKANTLTVSTLTKVRGNIYYHNSCF